jgi:hypothetical protein
MKKLIIGVAVATCISSVAMAEDKAVLPAMPNIDMSFVTDTERNTTQGTTATEFGIVAGVEGFDLSFLPKWSWDSEDISNVEFAVSYNYDVNDSLAITPYAKINTDSDLDVGDKLIGFKTQYKF